MSVQDELDAATKHLDQILEKLKTADPAGQPRLEAAAKAAQAKVQQILLAIQSLR